MEVKKKKCKVCAKLFKPLRSSLENTCSYVCAVKLNKPKTSKVKPKPIKRESKKRAKESPIYSKRRKEFLSRPENKYCVIRGTQCANYATTIEHTKGRSGYADEESRLKGETLLIDERFWLPACNPCNLELETNTELSQKFQLSKIHDGKKI